MATETSGEGQSPVKQEEPVVIQPLRIRQEPTPIARTDSTSHANDSPNGSSFSANISVDPSEDDDFTIDRFSEMPSNTSATASGFESVRAEDGRTYHHYRQGKYFLPNDDVWVSIDQLLVPVAESLYEDRTGSFEYDHLQHFPNRKLIKKDLQHQLWLMTLDGSLSLAPLKREPQHVLDLGTGTGAWAIDYAIEHPKVTVVGVDLSPIQPNLIPANCSFKVRDFDDEWVYEQNFDLIHGRLLLSCLTDTKAVFSRAYDSLAPGGYLEMQDADFPGRCDDNSLLNSNLEKWYSSAVAGFVAMGRSDLGIVKHYKRCMEEVGFVNVEEKLFFWPNNTWPLDPHLKKLGSGYRHDLVALVTALKAPFTKGLGWSLEEADNFGVKVKQDIIDRRIHAYHIMRVVYGMKPEVVESTPST